MGSEGEGGGREPTISLGPWSKELFSVSSADGSISTDSLLASLHSLLLLALIISVRYCCLQSVFEAKTAVCFFPVVGFGTDPDLQMDIITELDLVNISLGVTQVSGLHNASKAYVFQGKALPPLHGGGTWGGGSVWGVFMWCVFVRGSSPLFLLCHCHKVCSEISRVFR